VKQESEQVMIVEVSWWLYFGSVSLCLCVWRFFLFNLNDVCIPNVVGKLVCGQGTRQGKTKPKRNGVRLRLLSRWNTLRQCWLGSEHPSAVFPI